MKEKTVEKILVDGVKERGGRAYKFTSPGRRGVPDRIVVLPDARVYFVELKSPTGEESRLQEVERDYLTGLGFYACVLDTPARVRLFLTMTDEGDI